MEITQPLHRAVQLRPDAEMTVLGDRVRTVRECADRVARFAGALRAQGVTDGDRVAILALNSDVFHEALLGIPWAGGVAVPANWRWSPSEIAFSLKETGVEIMLVDDTFLDLALAVNEMDGVSTQLIHVGEKPTPEGGLDYEELLAATEPVEDARRGGSDIFGIFYTGGTTGVAKGVVLSHDQMMTSAYGCVASGEFASPNGRLMHVAPMFHLADLASWTGGMVVGSTHIFVPMFTPGGVAKMLAEQEITDVLMVPTMIQMLVDSPEIAGLDLSTVGHIIYGASPMPEALQTRARAVFSKATFLQAYGMTELAPVATMLMSEDHDHPVRRRSAGRAAMHCEVRVVDELDNEVERGTVGEIVVRGGATMTGYWQRRTRRPRRCAAAGCTPATAATWTRTATSSSSTASRT